MANGFMGFLLGIGACIVLTSWAINLQLDKCEQENNVHKCTLISVPVEVK